MKKRAALLGRVSTDNQAEKGYSLTTQIAACRKYAEEQGWEVVGEFTDDCSGSIPVSERPGGAQIYELLRQGRIDVVVMYTMDRSARDKRDYPIEYLIFLRDIQDAGAELHFTDSGRSDGGILDLFKAWQASEERRKIRERSMRGKHAKAQAGKYVGGSQIPYGYKWLGKGRDGKLVVDDTTATIVKNVYSWYVHDRLTLNAIAKRLNEAGIPAPKAGQRKNSTGKWCHSTVRNLIKFRGYLGEFQFRGITIELPKMALVSKKTFETAQTTLRRNKELSPRNRKLDYLLTGYFRCTCGAVMCGGHEGIRKDGTARRYYRCGGRSSQNRFNCTQRGIVGGPEVEDLVWSHISRLLTNPEELDAGIEKMQRDREELIAPRKERLAVAEQAVENAKARMKRLISELGNTEDETIRDMIQSELKQIAQEHSAWETEVVAMSEEINRQIITKEDRVQIMEALNRIRDRVNGATYEQKRYLFELIELKVEWLPITEGKRFRVSCNISPEVILAFDDNSRSLDSRRYPPMRVRRR